MAQSMKIRVLVVDDSGFFQRRVTDIINKDPRLEVIATASNGQQAIEKTLLLKPDVITMDYEMPVMDGVTAVRHIMSLCPTPVLMFSSLTYEGARITLDALEAGAVDFLSKQFDAIAAPDAELHKTLTNRVCEVAASRKKRLTPTTAAKGVVQSLHHVDVVLIGTSTGGPVALKTIFQNIPAGFSKPIVIVQHMPAAFTKAFAERLNKFTSLTVKEAAQGDRLQAGYVYVAPGGLQLMIDKRAGGSIHIHESDKRISYRPSVDIALASAAKHFGRKALAIILTGMGSDGKVGADLLVQAGGTVWAQDEASCVIYGMPMAVVKAGIASRVLPLDSIGLQLFNEAC